MSDSLQEKWDKLKEIYPIPNRANDILDNTVILLAKNFHNQINQREFAKKLDYLQLIELAMYLSIELRACQYALNDLVPRNPGRD